MQVKMSKAESNAIFEISKKTPNITILNYLSNHYFVKSIYTTVESSLFLRNQCFVDFKSYLYP